MWSAPEYLAENYSIAVKQCLTDEVAFKNFKSNPNYIAIVGTPLPNQVGHFLSKIHNHPNIMNKIKEFSNNDTYGNPMYMMDNVGLSAGTIRYLFSLAYLETHFGNLDDMVISEMGVGYGGLAFVVGTLFKPKVYHLIDLPHVQQLALKYLSLLKISATDVPPPESVDLFISEFCLSEFDDEELYTFYAKYVKKAKNVFLTMNLIDNDRKQKFIDTMKSDFSLTIIDEGHGTSYPSYVIVGKKQ
jgi:hypothetical protein